MDPLEALTIDISAGAFYVYGAGGFSFYLGTWPSHLMDLLSLRLVGARINVRSSYSH